MSLTGIQAAIKTAARAAFIDEKTREGDAHGAAAYLWDAEPDGSKWKHNKISIAEATILAYEAAVKT